ncbi:hypothetical protein [Clostridium massiliamazoniense]|nr:hypothetical protein [Clostridium massiliamazoniense]
MQSFFINRLFIDDYKACLEIGSNKSYALPLLNVVRTVIECSKRNIK